MYYSGAVRCYSIESIIDKNSATFCSVARYKVPAGGWLSVHQWNFSAGNQPDADFPTLRAALDKASPTIAIQLLGNDGHHGAFNSAGLARAKNSKGTVVGLSKATLASDFPAFVKLVGVDADGNQDVLQLASSGHADDIAKTHVLGTWFQGKKVFTRPAT